MSNSRTINVGSSKVSGNGRFKLVCLKDPSKFVLTNIDSFIPYGKTIDNMVQFYDETGPVKFLLVSRIESILKPDDSDVDAKNVTTLIQHPDVRLLDLSDSEHEELVRLNLKKSNPRFTLINLDKSDQTKYEEEVDMYEISYLITTKKKNALSKKKMMYLASSVGVNIHSEIKDEERYLADLKQKTINHLRVNKDLRETFMHFYDNLEKAELEFYVNEMMRHGIIKDFGGMLKLEDKPIGYKRSDIMDYFAANEDEFNVLKEKIQKYNSNTVMR